LPGWLQNAENAENVGYSIQKCRKEGKQYENLCFSLFSAFLYRKTDVFCIFCIFGAIQASSIWLAGWSTGQPAWMGTKMLKMLKTSVFLYKNAEKKENTRRSTFGK
jgi:hypothetical protein